MKNDDLTLRDVTFLGALADYLLSVGADRAADAIYLVLDPTQRAIASSAQVATNRLNGRVHRTG